MGPTSSGEHSSARTKLKGGTIMKESLGGRVLVGGAIIDGDRN